MNNQFLDQPMIYFIKQALYFSNRFKGVQLLEKALQLSNDPKFKFIDTSISHLYISFDDKDATYETFNHINQHLTVMGHEPLIEANELFCVCPEIEKSITEAYEYIKYIKNTDQPVEFSNWLINQTVLNTTDTDDLNAKHQSNLQGNPMNKLHEDEFEYDFPCGLKTPKKYVVFEMDNVDAIGGMHDIIIDFDDFEEAKTFAIAHHEPCQIVDRDTWLFVEGDIYY